MYGIFSYIWLIFVVNVGKYTNPMDGMGKVIGKFAAQNFHTFPIFCATGSSHSFSSIGFSEEIQEAEALT